MEPERLTSAQNPKVKRLLALQEKSSLRRESGLFVVEGRRELEHCLAAGFEAEAVFVCPEVYSGNSVAGGESLLGRLASLDPSQPGGWAPPSYPAEGGRVLGGTRPPLSNRGCYVPQGKCPEPRGEEGGRVLGGTRPPLSNSGCYVPQGKCPEPRGEEGGRVLGGTRPATANRGCYVPQGKCQEPQVFELSKAVYEKVAYRGGTEGVIAEVRARYPGLEDLKLKARPLVMVLESVEKPGNLGAVLRSADAAGADAVIICDPLTDLYNPNLIRASIGAVFTVPVVCCTSAEAIAWLKAGGIRILTAQLQDSAPYYDVDMTCGTAIVMGTEATGLSDAWRKAADAHILIPMLGRLDSLNVSVSAAILLYEAVRQRQNL